MNAIIETASSTIEERIGNTTQVVQSATLTSSRVRTGLAPTPVRATIRPPMITPALSTPQSRPQACTDTSDRP